MNAALTVTEVLPRTLEFFDIGTSEGLAQLRIRYSRSDAAFLRLNMITAVTGASVGSDNTSETLTSRVDRGILKEIRRSADAVLVGAQTARAEGYIVPRDTRLAVVTATGDLSGLRVRDDEDLADRVLIVCPADRADAVAANARPGVRVVPAGVSGALDPEEILGALAALGHTRIVCEGGPRLATRFAAAGLVDEYCLTVAPTIEPTEHPFLQLSADDTVSTEPAGMLVDESGFSYLRLRTLR